VVFDNGNLGLKPGSMETEVSKRENRALNTGLVIVAVLAVVLIINLFMRISSPRPDPTRVFNPTGLLGDIVQIDVRNGCGVPGLAGEMTNFLRSYGFDVIEHGDFTSFDQDSTIIIDRIGHLDAANQVALALGISRHRVISDVRPDLYLDVSVIIGQDYRSVHPFRGGLEAE